MEILGYISAVAIGVLLGLLGGGGSILAVPVFVYFFDITATQATSYSLMVVLFGALIGFIKKREAGSVDIRAALGLGLASSLGVFLTRYFLLPSIDEKFEIFNLELTRDGLVIGLFILLALGSGIKMVFGKKETGDRAKANNYLLLITSGFAIGMLTAFVGAGGGFLIVPTLNLVLGMDMKKSVVVSLLIISANALVGVISDIAIGRDYDSVFLISFTAITFLGIWLGDSLSRRIHTNQLRIIFGYFVILLSIFILVKELMSAV